MASARLQRAAPAALAATLLAACLYAAFAHGAVASADEERLQLALAVIALGAAAAFSRGQLSLRAPRQVWLAGTSTRQPASSRSLTAAKPTVGRNRSTKQVTNNATRGFDGAI